MDANVKMTRVLIRDLEAFAQQKFFGWRLKCNSGGTIKNNCTQRKREKERDGGKEKREREREKRAQKREKDFESICVSGVFKSPQWRNLLLVGLRN